MTQKQAIANFFSDYSKFLNIDLSVSLLNKSNKYFGRNIDLIIIFQDTLYFLLKIRDSGSNADRRMLIQELRNTITQYTKIHNSEHLYIDSQKIYTTIKNDDFYLHAIFNESFIKYMDAYYISYRDFFQQIKKISLNDDVQNKFEINENNNTILVQAILEVNNALAHILAAIYKNDKDSLRNIDKAVNHLYRGSIDHYKMLIRLIYIEKNTTIDSKITEKFKELRFKEFEMIGESINKKVFLHDGKKDNILAHYKETFNEMLMKTSD